MLAAKIRKKIPSLLDHKSFLTGPENKDLLGRGSFGLVRRCYHETLNRVVIKYFPLNGSNEAISRKIQDAAKEAIVLKSLNHINIVKTFGITAWNDCCGIIMEEVPGGSLEDLLFNLNQKSLPWNVRGSFYRQLADAIKYLHNHSKKFVH